MRRGSDRWKGCSAGADRAGNGLRGDEGSSRAGFSDTLTLAVGLLRIPRVVAPPLPLGIESRGRQSPEGKDGARPAERENPKRELNHGETGKQKGTWWKCDVMVEQEGINFTRKRHPNGDA